MDKKEYTNLKNDIQKKFETIKKHQEIETILGQVDVLLNNYNAITNLEKEKNLFQIKIVWFMGSY